MSHGREDIDARLGRNSAWGRRSEVNHHRFSALRLGWLYGLFDLFISCREKCVTLWLKERKIRDQFGVQSWGWSRLTWSRFPPHCDFAGLLTWSKFCLRTSLDWLLIKFVNESFAIFQPRLNYRTIPTIDRVWVQLRLICWGDLNNNIVDLWTNWW